MTNYLRNNLVNTKRCVKLLPDMCVLAKVIRSI
nr:MAG TPA: hypothetical protein [Caudoviricetes sp.]